MNEQLTFDRGLQFERRRKARKDGGRSSFRRPEFSFRFCDDFSFDRRCDATLRTVKDFSGQQFVADFEAFARLASRPLSALEADFVWTAVAIYMADRFAPRRPFGSGGVPFWRRRIDVQIPVREVEHWKSATPLLLALLGFLTEDDWTLDFVPQRAAFSAEVQRRFQEFKRQEVQWTSLFSGGLDSLAGALQWLESTAGAGLLVSGETHGRLRVAQQELVGELMERYPARISHCGIDYRLPEKVEESGIESSQRVRAFVHVCFGALASRLAGCSELYLFENGVGAMNLACDNSQIGSQNSRGTHPVFLLQMSEFVSAVFAQQFTVSNPFLFKTKGQMLEIPMMAGLEALLQKSFSCDVFPNYHHKASQCGHCPSCLIRRLAFHTAGREDLASQYAIDLFAPHRALRASEIFALEKLGTQAMDMRIALSTKNPWNALVAKWPILVASDRRIGHPVFREGIIGLLRQHVEEWEVLHENLLPRRLAFAA